MSTTEQRHDEFLTDELERPPGEPEAPQEAEVEDGSILGHLNALRDRKAREAAPMKDFAVPGYGDGLIVRYRYPDGGYKRAIKAAQRENLSSDPDARLNGAGDLLIACCGSVLGKLPDGTVVDLRTDHPLGEGELPESPLRFDTALAEKFRITVPDGVSSVSRFVLRAIFSPRGLSQGEWDGDLALISQSNQVFMWLNKAQESLDEDLAGE